MTESPEQDALRVAPEDAPDDPETEAVSQAAETAAEPQEAPTGAPDPAEGEPDKVVAAQEPDPETPPLKAAESVTARVKAAVARIERALDPREHEADHPARLPPASRPCPAGG